MPDFHLVPIVKVSECQLYQPGHAAHFIQARVCWSEERVHEVELVEIGMDFLTVHDDGQVLKLMHHDIEGLRAVVGHGYESLHLTVSCTLLTLGMAGGGYMSFSVKPDDGTQLGPCGGR